jgi:hypothetical protein
MGAKILAAHSERNCARIRPLLIKAAIYIRRGSFWIQEQLEASRRFAALRRLRQSRRISVGGVIFEKLSDRSP